MMRKAVVGVFLVAAILFVQCTTGLDGGGSEITNGKLVGMSGAPLQGRTIDAYPETYIHRRSAASSVTQTITADDGTFELDIDSGIYNLYFVDTATMSGVCVREIVAGRQLGTIRLDSLGAIAGTVRTTDTSKYRVPLTVYSKGVPFIWSIGSNDSTFRFELVPQGTFPLSLATMPPTGCAPGQDCNPGGDEKPEVFSSVKVDGGMTTVVDTVISIDDIGTLP